MKGIVGPGWDVGLKQTRDLSDGWAAGTEGSCRSWQAEVRCPPEPGRARRLPLGSELSRRRSIAASASQICLNRRAGETSIILIPLQGVQSVLCRLLTRLSQARCRLIIASGCISHSFLVNK